MWYHKYVYDSESQKLIGEFEKLYQEGEREGLDAWHQDSLATREDVLIAQSMLSDLKSSESIAGIIDIGCGKGTLAHHLFPTAKNYLGIDVSATAISAARQNFPNMNFVRADVQNGQDLADLVSHRFVGELDLVFSCQTLSFVNDWKSVVELSAKLSRALLVVLYLPSNPIGRVKSFGELVDEFWRNFEKIQCTFSVSASHIAISGVSGR